MRSFDDLKPTKEELDELNRRIESKIELIPGVDDRLIEIYKAQTTEFTDADDLEAKMSKDDKIALDIMKSNLPFFTTLLENLQKSVPDPNNDPSLFLNNLYMLWEGITEAVSKYNENRKQKQLGADEKLSIELNNAVFAQLFKYFPTRLTPSQIYYCYSLGAEMKELGNDLFSENFPPRFDRLSMNWPPERIYQTAQLCNSMDMMLLKFNNYYPKPEKDFKQIACKEYLDKYITRFYQFKILLETFPLEDKSEIANSLRVAITKYVELFEPSTPTPKATIFSALWGGKKEDKNSPENKDVREAKLVQEMQDVINDYKAQSKSDLPLYMKHILSTINGTRPPVMTPDKHSLKPMSGS